MKSFVVLCGILALPASLAFAQAPADAPPVSPPPAQAPAEAPAEAPPAQAPPAPVPPVPAPPVAAPVDTAPATKPPSTSPKTTVAPTTSTPASAVPADDGERLALATAAYNAGLAALHKSDWNGAASNFERATQLSPSDAGAFAFLGFVRLQQKQWDQALVALGAAQDNAKGLGVHWRAQLLNNIGFARWNKGQIAEAKTAYNAALELDPAYTEARYNLAFVLLSNSQFADALPQFKLLAAATPNDATVQDGLGDTFSQMNNMAGTLGAYKRATQLAPKNAEYKWKFALALIKGARPDAASAQLREMLQLDPTNAPALLQMGDLHIKAGRFGDAVTVLKRYVQIKPDDFTGHFNLAVAYDYTPKFDEALQEYAIAERLLPQDAATQNNIGRIYFKRGRFPEAIAKFNEALKIDSNFPDARINLATVLAEQSKWEDSNAQWQTIAVNAENSLRGAKTATNRALYSSRAATAHSGLANNFMAQKEYQKAVDEYRRMLTVAPGDVEARSGLGRALYNLKDYAGAQTAYKAIIAADPKNANAWSDLGVTLEARGNRKGALEAYAQALNIAPNHAEASRNLARLKKAAPIG